MTKDQFAWFFFSKALSKVEHYIFDTFYDIKTIMNENEQLLKKKVVDFGSFPTDAPIYNEYFWFIRKTGSDICKEGDDLKNSYIKYNQFYFKLSFCLNSDYFAEESYCLVTRYNSNEID